MSQQDSAATQEAAAIACAIGIDVGGTKIDGVLIDPFGTVLADAHQPTHAGGGTDAVIDRIAGVIAGLIEAAAGRPLAGVGLGCPGQVDARSGVVRAAVNLGWQDVPLRAALLDRLGKPDLALTLANDVNALALGEVRFGAAQMLRDVVYLAVGTGLGGGAVVDGRIVSGANHFAMEVGHIVLRPGGRLCACGLRGCAEAYVSGVGILNGIHDHIGAAPDSALAAETTLTVPGILKAARSGDALAQVILDEAGDMLGAIMAVCAGTLNPEAFVIGGGLGRAAGDLLLPRAEAALRARVLPPAWEKVRVMTATVERAAVGAASLAL